MQSFLSIWQKLKSFPARNRKADDVMDHRGKLNPAGDLLLGQRFYQIAFLRLSKVEHWLALSLSLSPLSLFFYLLPV